MNSSQYYYVHLLIIGLIHIVILNNVHLGSYFYINIYMLALYILPHKVKGIPLLLIGFGTGILMDMASHTAGIHAAASTLVAYTRPYFLRGITEGAEEYGQDGHRMLEAGWFFRYSLLSTFLFHLVLVLMEAFSFRDIGISLLRIVSSTFISEVFVMLYYFIGLKRLTK